MEFFYCVYFSYLHFAGIEKRQKHEATVAAQGVKKKVRKISNCIHNS